MRAILMVVIAVSAERSVLADELVPDRPVEQRVPRSRVRDLRVETQPYVFVPMSTSGTLGTDAPIDLDVGEVIDKLQLQRQSPVDLWKRRFGVVEVAYRIDWIDESREPSFDLTTYASLGFRLGSRSSY